MNDDVSAHSQEVALVRMPTPVSDVVDQAIDRFINSWPGGMLISGWQIDEIHAHKRWHGADLWMVYTDSIHERLMLFLTHRVTIAAYSDDPDRLLFIPDIVVTKPDGRYILAAESRKSQSPWSIIDLTRELMDKSTTVADVAMRLALGLGDAFDASMTFSPDQATQPVL